jgi:hypothetical protein
LSILFGLIKESKYEIKYSEMHDAFKLFDRMKFLLENSENEEMKKYIKEQLELMIYTF